MKKIALIVISMIILASCGEEYEDMTVNIDSTGNLNIQVLGPDGEGYPGASVRVYTNNNWGYNLALDTTDSQGFFDAGDLLEKQYNVATSLSVENRIYTDEKTVHVIAGQNHNLVFDPYSNSGSASLYFLESFSDTALSGLNAAVLSSSDYPVNYDFDHDELIDKAYFIKQTDENGHISLENLPAGENVYAPAAYYIYLYKDEEQSTLIDIHMEIRKDETHVNTFKVYWPY